jgi:hypothetical protein
MPNKRHLNNARRAVFILEARAGLIPASDAIENEQRARMKCIGRVVKAYAKLVSARPCDWDHLAITDILADLRHYCDYIGLAFDELGAAAYEQCLEDAADMSGNVGYGKERKRSI